MSDLTCPDLTYRDYCWEPDGSFRQKRLQPRVQYDGAYLWDRYVAIDDQVRALALARLRVLEAFHALPGKLLDFGCGTGRFAGAAIAAGWQAFGIDLAPGPGPRCDWPQAAGQGWDVVTFFDSLEHLPHPRATIRALAPATLMISVPECHFPEDPSWFMHWKHRRPGEHLWHWHASSLDRFLRGLGYEGIAWSHFEDLFRPRAVPDEPNILTVIYRRM